MLYFGVGFVVVYSFTHLFRFAGEESSCQTKPTREELSHFLLYASWLHPTRERLGYASGLFSILFYMLVFTQSPCSSWSQRSFTTWVRVAVYQIQPSMMSRTLPVLVNLSYMYTVRVGVVVCVYVGVCLYSLAYSAYKVTYNTCNFTHENIFNYLTP